MRSRWLVVALAGCHANAGPAAPAHADLAFRDVRVFDGTRATEHQTVLVDHGRVVAVGATGELAVPAGTTVIDGAGQTLLPGLIDAHAHVTSADDLRDALAFGVTTELDMMSVPAMTVPLSRDDTALDRARVVPAGYAATAPHGHGTEYGFAVPTLTRADEAEAFVAARAGEGSHHLKIIVEDGSELGHTLPTLDAATVHALVDAAHAHHLMAVAHVGSTADVASAVAAGVDGLAHVTLAPFDAATIAALARAHAFVVPTLSVLASVCARKPGAELATDRELARLLMPGARDQLVAGFPPFTLTTCDAPAATVRALHDAGVAILAGTDAPNPGTGHGISVHGELSRLVAAGLTPSEALAAATSLPASRFGVADVGVIRAGAIADLVLVAGDPTHDIAATRALRGVWRGGRRVDLDARVAAVAKAVEAAAASKPTPGPLADFDTGDAPATRFGRIAATSDAMRGGTSTATATLQPGGAASSPRALAVAGTVDTATFAWAGVMFVPSTQGFSAVDFTPIHRVRFWARGDGHTCQLLVFTGPTQPKAHPFTAPDAWTEVAIDLDDPTHVAAIAWVVTTPGAYHFAIDQIALE